MRRIFSDEDIELIKTHYPKYGAKYCQSLIGEHVTSCQIAAKAQGLKVRRSSVRSTHQSLQKVRIDQFLNVTKPEVAYFLGYFWADGYLVKRKVPKSPPSEIVIEITEEDAKDIKEVFLSLGKWGISRRHREGNKPTWAFRTSNVELYEFLEGLGFGTKSHCSHEKVLKIIPSHLLKNFWRGYFDGDGCISFINNRYPSMTFCGSFSQDWSSVSSLLTSMNIGVHIHRVERKTGKVSVVTVYNIKDCRILSLFFLTSSIGLSRKTSILQRSSLTFTKREDKLLREVMS